MQIIDGKKTAAAIRQELKDQVAVLTARHGRAPGLAVILVGGDPASQVYVRNKERACEDVGIISKGFRLPEDVPQAQLEDTIMYLNSDSAIDGLLLQLPLPKGLDSQRCLDLISPSKDVDGFHPMNMGRLALGLPCLRSCTPAGIMTLMERHGIDVAGKKAVVIGRSNIVGKPLALMLLQKNATVTVCHSRTRDIAEEVRSADIVLAAVGIPRFVTRDMVKPGAVVIDVGINRTDLGLVGDCDFEGLRDVASAMTPVPGGVGPMTIAQLLVNTLEAYVEHVG
ncbi:bifunctional methylenetetrahydrofolate dehydrogenase/methenyltetrahydrofolate cyclohydrolase FolD [Desulfomicrobium sp. ZS1]|jgi:methylenetetrahydrofolate dehydrogenase (NADP+)/methenyltetrahydrofolate cyclohydrolase|uniref:bifunctional methylenetetrahydrofolate dehydrogenase/methenyltetrahydrofolate cyclohydrolase FolD n=1 Tax=Desulfomicrobium sp. ZS1 TaxID=2952228 RepID=UPI0020B25A7D|nr:bifunctional methylenetetrahydrofolate dehydrogenase/methenyltetrahydrofolate cyclohydrolase FolD [Desulfomicrobium sp. ZS1]UTF50061.1 bifunctional methylenetetrahydrofolate dehydrogenase/methenyltetrahydrofolate cyclohydrolase FolD [Desulfomicrobium sp. ZS1]